MLLTIRSESEATRNQYLKWSSILPYSHQDPTKTSQTDENLLTQNFKGTQQRNCERKTKQNKTVEHMCQERERFLLILF